MQLFRFIPIEGILEFPQKLQLKNVTKMKHSSSINYTSMPYSVELCICKKVICRKVINFALSIGH